MKQTVTASVWQEGDWFVAQSLKVDLARQWKSEEEALELHFEEPRATVIPRKCQVEVEVSAT